MCTDVAQWLKDMLEFPAEIHQYHWNLKKKESINSTPVMKSWLKQRGSRIQMQLTLFKQTVDKTQTRDHDEELAQHKNNIKNSERLN